MNASPHLFVVMGVSACGKSTLAKALAEACDGEYLDADDFHPPENVSKMRSGQPLNDADRAGWLERLNAELRARAHQDRPVFLACSALKRAYRDTLRRGGLQIAFIHMHASKAVIRERIERRKDHFMPPALLDSQFDTLEEPKRALVVDATKPSAELVQEVRRAHPQVAWK